MARDYQRKKNNKYIMPRAVYNQTLWIIRDYNRLKFEADAILEESPAPSDGMPHGTNTSDPVEAKAFRREEYLHKMKCIDDAKSVIPEEYMNGIWRSIQEYAPFPFDAHRNTYSLWRTRYIYEVAKRFKLI